MSEPALFWAAGLIAAGFAVLAWLDHLIHKDDLKLED